jgi:uncharacterized protein YdaU (DUF1376 family)
MRLPGTPVLAHWAYRDGELGMAAPWQQWMPFHIDRFRGSPAVQAMHPAARCGYLYLLAAMWQTEDCSLSADPLELAEASGLGDELWNQYETRIMRAMTILENGRVSNTVCYEEWQKASKKFAGTTAISESTREKRSKAGKAGSVIRWGSKCHEEVKQTDSKLEKVDSKHDSKPIAKDSFTGTVTSTETKASSSTLAPSSLELTASATPEPVIGFLECLPGKAAGPTRWPVTQARARQWAKAYPAVNIPLELQRMRIWIEDNPKSRKTHDGMGNFCTRWLKQEQNKAGGNGNGNGSGRNGFQLFARPGDARSALEEYAEREQRGAEHSGSAGRTLAGTTGEDQRGCDRDVRASPAALLDR